MMMIFFSQTTMTTTMPCTHGAIWSGEWDVIGTCLELVQTAPRGKVQLGFHPLRENKLGSPHQRNQDYLGRGRRSV